MSELTNAEKEKAAADFDKQRELGSLITTEKPTSHFAEKSTEQRIQQLVDYIQTDALEAAQQLDTAKKEARQEAEEQIKHIEASTGPLKERGKTLEHFYNQNLSHTIKGKDSLLSFTENLRNLCNIVGAEDSITLLGGDRELYRKIMHFTPSAMVDRRQDIQDSLSLLAQLPDFKPRSITAELLTKLKPSIEM